MKLYLQGHDYRYAVEQIMLTLYPQHRPEYVQNRKELSGDSAAVSLSCGADFYTAVTRLHREGKTYTGTARLKNREFGDKLSRDSALSQLVKRSFYRAAYLDRGETPAWGMLTGIRPAKIATKLLENGASAVKAQSLMQKEYYVSPMRSRLCVQSAQASLEVKHRVRGEDISLYVGIPFCPTRCAYCSFVSNSVEKSHKLIDPYLAALYKEIEHVAQLCKDLELRVKSVYFGGGTPTTLSTDRLAALIDKLDAEFDLNGIEEYTVEAGRPDTVDSEKFAMLKEKGVDRVSINPQTMDDRVLEIIGRNHTGEDILRAYEQARAAGIKAINMDLIAGLPGDSPEGFKRSIDTVLQLQPENITVHTLSLKRGSRLRLEQAGIPDGNGVSEMLDYGWQRIYDEGYMPYYLYRQKFMAGNFENIGWSKEGFQCLYNIYIMEELHSIISLGAGGTTKLVDQTAGRIERIFNAKYPYEYMENLNKSLASKDYISQFYSDLKGRI